MQISAQISSGSFPDDVSALTMLSRPDDLQRFMLEMNQRAGPPAQLPSRTARNKETPVQSSNNTEGALLLHLTNQLIQVKLELATAKSSEDCLKHEVAKIKLALGRLEAENEELRQDKNNEIEESKSSVKKEAGDRAHDTGLSRRVTASTSDTDTISDGTASVAEVIHRPIGTPVGDSRELIHSYPINTEARSRRMPNLPSCASGIAFLNDVANAQQPQWQASVTSQSSFGMKLSRKNPSCASGIALLTMGYAMQSCDSMSSLGKRKPSLLGTDYEAYAAINPQAALAAVTAGSRNRMVQSSSFQKRRCSVSSASYTGNTAPTQASTQETRRHRKCRTATTRSSLTRSHAKYEAQRNEEWGDSGAIAPARVNNMFKSLMKEL